MRTNARTRSAYITVHGAQVARNDSAPDLPTAPEIFAWVCAHQHVDPSRLSDARYRSLSNISSHTYSRIMQLYHDPNDRAEWLDRIAEIQNKPAATTAWAIITPWLTPDARPLSGSVTDEERSAR